MQKLIVCIADGAADDPSLCPEGTPLELAETPVLDSMTRHSVAGLCYTIPEGFNPDSDVGNMSLFGYDPSRYHNGRAPIEAAALRSVQDTQRSSLHTPQNQSAPNLLHPSTPSKAFPTATSDDLIWRVTFSQAQDNIITLPCASSITQKEGEQLVDALNASCHTADCTFISNKSYRHLLLQKNGRLLLEEHNCAQVEQGKQSFATCGPHLLQNIPLAEHQALYPEPLQRIMHEGANLLAEHTDKANFLWLWGQGSPYTLPDFAEQHGTNACIISGIPLLHGLGHMANMQVICHPSFTGLPDTDLAAKAHAAIEFLQSDGNDIAFIHIEAPDHCGHLGDSDGKVRAIERIDQKLLPIILQEMPDACIAMTIDHLTPAATKSHAHGAVSFVAYHPSIPPQNVVHRWTENECKKGMHLSKNTSLLAMIKTIDVANIDNS